MSESNRRVSQPDGSDVYEKARKPKDPTEGYGRNEPDSIWQPSKVRYSDYHADPNADMEYNHDTGEFVDSNHIWFREEEPVYENNDSAPGAAPELVGWNERPDVMDTAVSVRDVVDPRSVEKAIPTVKPSPFVARRKAMKMAIAPDVNVGDQVTFRSTRESLDNAIPQMTQEGHTPETINDVINYGSTERGGRVTGREGDVVTIDGEGRGWNYDGAYYDVRKKMAFDPSLKEGDPVSTTAAGAIAGDRAEGRTVREGDTDRPMTGAELAELYREEGVVGRLNRDPKTGVPEARIDRPDGGFYTVDSENWDVRKKMALDPNVQIGDEVDVELTPSARHNLSRRFQAPGDGQYLQGMRGRVTDIQDQRVYLDQVQSPGDPEVTESDVSANIYDITPRKKSLKALRAKYKAGDWEYEYENFNDDRGEDDFPELWSAEEDAQWDAEIDERLRKQDEEWAARKRSAAAAEQSSGPLSPSSIDRRMDEHWPADVPVDPAQDGIPTGKFRRKSGGPGESSATQGRRATDHLAAYDPKTNSTRIEEPATSTRRTVYHGPQGAPSRDLVADLVTEQGGEAFARTKNAPRTEDQLQELADYGFGPDEGVEILPASYFDDDDTSSTSGFILNSGRLTDAKSTPPMTEDESEFDDLLNNPSLEGNSWEDPNKHNPHTVIDLGDYADDFDAYLDRMDAELKAIGRGVQGIGRSAAKSGDPGGSDQGNNINPETVYYAEKNPYDPKGSSYLVTRQRGGNSRAAKVQVEYADEPQQAVERAQHEATTDNTYYGNGQGEWHQDLLDRGHEQGAHAIDQTGKAMSAFQDDLGGALVAPPQQGNPRERKRKLGQKSVTAPVIGRKGSLVIFEDSGKPGVAIERTYSDNGFNGDPNAPYDVQENRHLPEHNLSYGGDSAAGTPLSVRDERQVAQNKSLADGQKGDFSGVHKDVLGRVVCWFNGKRTPCPRKPAKQRPKPKPGGRYPEPEEELVDEVDQAQAEEGGSNLPPPSYLAPAQSQAYHTPVAPGDLECRFYVSNGVLKPITFYTVPALTEINELSQDGLPAPVNAAHLRLLNLFNGFPPAPTTGFMGLDLSMSEALTLQFLETCLKSQQERVPLAFPGLTPLVTDPAVEFGGNFKLAVSANRAIPFGADELLLESGSALVVTDIEQVDVLFVIHMQQIEPDVMLPTEPDGTETPERTQQDTDLVVEEETSDPTPG